MKTSHTIVACLATAVLSVGATLGIAHMREPTADEMIAAMRPYVSDADRFMYVTCAKWDRFEDCPQVQDMAEARRAAVEIEMDYALRNDDPAPQ